MRKHGILFQKGVEKNKGALVQKKVTFFWVVLLGRGRRKVKGVFVHEKLFRKSTLFFRREYRKNERKRVFCAVFFGGGGWVCCRVCVACRNTMTDQTIVGLIVENTQ